VAEGTRPSERTRVTGLRLASLRIDYHCIRNLSSFKILVSLGNASWGGEGTLLDYCVKQKCSVAGSPVQGPFLTKSPRRVSLYLIIDKPVRLNKPVGIG